MSLDPPTSNEFLSLPRAQVATLVQQQGPKTVVLCVAGSRRWYVLRAGQGQFDWPGYGQALSRRYRELFVLLFESGIHTILTPAVYPPNFQRGPAYVSRMLQGVPQLVQSAEFQDFYRDLDVRAGLYGNALSAPAFPQLAALDRELRQATAAYQSRRLLWGLNCDDDLLADVLRLAVAHFQETGAVPTRAQLVERYYGWPVGAVDIFVGAGRPSIFNLMPPLLDGREDLYFTVGLSLDLTEAQWREILYDHLWRRPKKTHQWNDLEPAIVAWLRRFYDANQGQTLGVGQLGPGDVWFARQAEAGP
ncbi:MAG: hypothetical protein KKB13_11035 [Chloroflexi bacterium]|nr:hypothetical protein [Chloroflexota bacterium]